MSHLSDFGVQNDTQNATLAAPSWLTGQDLGGSFFLGHPKQGEKVEREGDLMLEGGTFAALTAVKYKKVFTKRLISGKLVRHFLCPLHHS
jgi:hypothetical protein